MKPEGRREVTRREPQLERIDLELVEARRRTHDLAAPLTAEDWSTRPAVDQWSVAECVIHLNLTSVALLPLIRDAITRGRAQKLLGPGPYRRDLVGWFLYWMTEPPVRFRVKTTAAFVPAGVEPKDRVLEAFDALQAELAACVTEANGLAYNLYSCLRIVPAHQRQHLLQAAQALESLRERR
jgi:hypothetical protein